MAAIKAKIIGLLLLAKQTPKTPPKNGSILIFQVWLSGIHRRQLRYRPHNNERSLFNRARVAVSGLTLDALQETVAKYGPNKVIALTSDISDKSSVTQLVDRVLHVFGSIDVVLFNAAGYESGELADSGEYAWHALSNANLVCSSSPKITPQSVR